MPTIQILPAILVNKIAAGEVIERPASVVKELLENALDACATQIRLTIEDGGKKRIRVDDNGCGMQAEELPLAVSAHATSKIQGEEDLYHIRTMGFRGEALSSISAVSHLVITSRPATSMAGARIHVAGEKVESKTAAGCPVGTAVEIRDLFFNVPARRKFLRGSNTEFGHVQEQLARIALPNPHVEFEFVSGQRTVKHLLPCKNMRERIAAFYGDALLPDLLPIQRQERGMQIDGYVARPAQSKTSTRWQYVFLNGRYVRDRFIQHAMKEAYRGLMEPARHPVVFLALTVDPGTIDINVHPTKIEVRWQDSNVVYSQVLSALREALLGADLTPALRTPAIDRAPSPAERLQERQRIADFFKQLTPVQSSFSGAPARRDAAPPSVSMSDLALKFQSAPPTPETPAGSTPAPQHPPLPTPNAIQLHRTYLVTETEDGILIIDQHALHERLLYEQLHKRLASGTLQSQRLLIPETIEFTPQQIALLEAHQELLNKLGIEITLYGRTTVAVQSVPPVLRSATIDTFLSDVVERLAEVDCQPDTEALLQALLSMMACKAAVKAGDALKTQEINELLAQRDLADKRSNCPHGRPTTLRLTLADLERQFKRT